jgi:GNAT superfamily N-acetyltransferase
LLTEAQNLATRLVGTTENGLRETIESGGAVIIAVRNGEVVGTTTAYLVDTADAELLAAVLPELAGQRLGQVEDVAVDYSARGHGLASAMVAEATEWLNDRDDVDCIVIASWEHQGPNAHNIYRRLDYREVATVEDFWNKTSDPEHPAESSCPECGPTCGCTAIVFVMP